MSDRLGTAQWEDDTVVAQRYSFDEGKFWLGRGIDATALGYRDDRHICLVSGNRAGKGTSIIVNNLSVWPGSAVVIDPKGENATVTAARRGNGSEHCLGMGQAVHVLDPFGATRVDSCYRSSFNPLADLDPESEEAIDEADRLAEAMVVVNEKDPVWDESAREILQALILHVLTATEFTDDERNLITVRRRITKGEWRVADALREMGHGDTMDSPHLLLWKAMELNPAFDGIIAGIGSEYRFMMQQSAKTYVGISRALKQHTKFLDSPGLRRVLGKSKFKLSELKTRREGMTVYLSLPQRFMETHVRWLRMMVALTTTEMEKTPSQPASGHRVLMVLDEFAGLKRMRSIENAAAQIAGFGVKLFFVLQGLQQLKDVYKDNWETFLGNAGLKVFFSIDDHFTREYVSKLAGETEIIRELRNFNESQSQNESEAVGSSQSKTLSQSTMSGTSESASRSQTEGVNASNTRGTSETRSETETFGTTQSTSMSSGSSGGSSYSHGPNGSSSTSSYGHNSSMSVSQGTSHSTAHGISQGTSNSTTKGRSSSFTSGLTTGTSRSDTRGSSDTTGITQTRTVGTSRTAGSGRNETIHRRPLIQPDEVGRHFARIDDRSHPHYPGLALVLVSGANPFIVKRSQYFVDPYFIDCFSPHPDHKFVPALSCTVSGRSLIAQLLETDIVNVSNDPKPYIHGWFVGPGHVVTVGQAVARVEYEPGHCYRLDPPKKPRLIAPYTGKVTAREGGLLRLPHKEYDVWTIPDGPLFTIKHYPDVDQNDIDPFSEIRALPRRKLLEPPKPIEQPKLVVLPKPVAQPKLVRSKPDVDPPFSMWPMVCAFVALIGIAGYFLAIYHPVVFGCALIAVIAWASYLGLWGDLVAVMVDWMQQAAKSGIQPRDVAVTLKQLWKEADSAKSFAATLPENGLTLALGSRDLVVLDQAGDVHTLARCLNLKVADIRERMADIDRSKIPTVEQAREAIHERTAEKEAPAPTWDRDRANESWQYAVNTAAIEMAKNTARFVGQRTDGGTLAGGSGEKKEQQPGQHAANDNPQRAEIRALAARLQKQIEGEERGAPTSNNTAEKERMLAFGYDPSTPSTVAKWLELDGKVETGRITGKDRFREMALYLWHESDKERRAVQKEKQSAQQAAPERPPDLDRDR